MPTNLTSSKIKDTFDQLLHVSGGVSATLTPVHGGTGTATALSVATGKVGLNGVVTVGLSSADTMTVTATSNFVGPLRIGGVTVLPTAAELNFVDGVTSAIQTQLNNRPTLADPRLFGAVMDGTTNDTAALQACVNFHGRVELPPGKTIRVLAPVVIPAGLISFSIAGGIGSVIRWAGDTIAQNFLDFDTNYGPNNIPIVEMRNFEVIGSHAANLSFLSSYPLYVRNATRVIFDGVVVSYSRVMGIVARQCDFVSVTNCEVHHCARDGISVEDCNETIVSHNFIHDCDDDAIAVHNSVFSWQRGHVIANNKITRAQGIRAQGLNVATITGNVIQFFVSHGINVESVGYNAALSSGLSPTIALTITGNTLADGFNRQFLDNLNQGCRYIRVVAHSAQTGTLAHVPGWRGTSPYDYYGNIHLYANLAATTPIPESGNIIIANNTMMRTLPLTGLFSAQGFGKFWLRGGEYDYNLDSATAARFVVVGGYLRDMVIEGNVCSGASKFLDIRAADLGVIEPIRNMKVRGNVVSDIGEQIVGVATTTQTLDIEFSGNTFDMDPYHIHANRGATGGWLADGGPQVFLRQGALGTQWRDNDFKNACRFSEATLASMVNANVLAYERNRIWGAPAATGFSTANLGFGNIPTVAGHALVHIECNPASADYGKIYRPGPTVNPTIPTTGTFMYGEFVQKTGQVIESSAVDEFRYIVQGWDRLTTGTGHVVNTDWHERRTRTTLISTAAGWGGTVAQATSKATAVTLNTYSGLITVAADALAAGASVEFEVNNSLVTANLIPIVVPVTSSLNYSVSVKSSLTGRFGIRITNTTAGSLSQAFAIGFRLLNIAVS